jgi:hypothetical protein
VRQVLLAERAVFNVNRYIVSHLFVIHEPEYVGQGCIDTSFIFVCSSVSNWPPIHFFFRVGGVSAYSGIEWPLTSSHVRVRRGKREESNRQQVEEKEEKKEFFQDENKKGKFFLLLFPT